MNNDFQPKPVSDCFHIYSNGEKMNALFSAREDKILAMNMIAITSFANGVKILADQIMETHFHAIVSGSVSACAKFKKDLKLNFGVYYTPAENLCYTAMKKFKEKAIQIIV